MKFNLKTSVPPEQVKVAGVITTMSGELSVNRDDWLLTLASGEVIAVSDRAFAEFEQIARREKKAPVLYEVDGEKLMIARKKLPGSPGYLKFSNRFNEKCASYGVNNKLTPIQISDYEKEKHTPSMDRILAMCWAMGISLKDILREVELPENPAEMIDDDAEKKLSKLVNKKPSNPWAEEEDDDFELETE